MSLRSAHPWSQLESFLPSWKLSPMSLLQAFHILNRQTLATSTCLILSSSLASMCSLLTHQNLLGAQQALDAGLGTQGPRVTKREVRPPQGPPITCETEIISA